MFLLSMVTHATSSGIMSHIRVWWSDKVNREQGILSHKVLCKGIEMTSSKAVSGSPLLKIRELPAVRRTQSITIGKSFLGQQRYSVFSIRYSAKKVYMAHLFLCYVNKIKYFLDLRKSLDMFNTLFHIYAKNEESLILKFEKIIIWIHFVKLICIKLR